MTALATSPTDLAAARAAVEGVFAGRPYPGSDRVAVTRADDPSYEGNAVARWFDGRPWTSVDYDRIVADYPGPPSACLSFMTVAGFCYYLPSFLVSALEPRGRFWADVAETVSFALTRPGDEAPSLRTRFDAIVAALAPEERTAVAGALRALAAEYARAGFPINLAERALDGFWAAEERRLSCS